MPPTPMPKATPRPSAPAPGNVLPLDSTLLFVLDDPISSKASKPGQLAHAHLKTAIVVGGHTIAKAGAPVQIRIVDVSPADIADVYGFVDIFFEPLTLSDGRTLPLRAPISRLTPEVSSGHESTVGAEDTVGDIFVPYYPLYQILRKGKNFVLGSGFGYPGRHRSDAHGTAERCDCNRHAASASAKHRSAELDVSHDAACHALWPRHDASRAQHAETFAFAGSRLAGSLTLARLARLRRCFRGDHLERAPEKVRYARAHSIDVHARGFCARRRTRFRRDALARRSAFTRAAGNGTRVCQANSVGSRLAFSDAG